MKKIFKSTNLFFAGSVIDVVVVRASDFLPARIQLLPERAFEVALEPLEHVVRLPQQAMNSNDADVSGGTVGFVVAVVVVFAADLDLDSLEGPRTGSPPATDLGVVRVLSQQPVVVDLTLSSAEKKFQHRIIKPNHWNQ